MDNLIGRRFGKFVVKSFSHVKGRYVRYWNCQCDCGAKVAVIGANLTRKDRPPPGGCRRCSHMRHGHSIGNKTHTGRSPTYTSWLGMFSRVRGRSDKLRYSYAGISICDRWNSYENFLADMGERPSKRHTLDRISNAGNYEPSNCRWADWKTQLSNRRKRRDQLPKKRDS